MEYLTSEIIIKQEEEDSNTSEELLSKKELEKKLNSESEQNNLIICLDAKDKKSESWKNFEEIYYKNVKQHFVRCKICKTLIVYKTSTGTAGIMRHKCRKSWQHSIANNDVPTNATFTPRNDNEGGRKLAKLQLDFITADLHSFDVCEGEEFKSLCQELINVGIKNGNQNIDDLLLPKIALTESVLPEVMEDKKRAIQMLLDRSVAVTFTCDVWYDNFKEKNFLTLGGHTLSEHFILCSFVLGTKEFDDNNIDKNLSLVASKILENYVSQADAQILLEANIIVTDNSAKVVKGFKNYKRISCMCHNLNIFIEDLVKNFPLEIKDTIQSVSTLVEYFIDSSLNFLTTPLKENNSTKWNSLYVMMETFNEMHHEVYQALSDRNELTRLQEINMSTLKICLDFLKIFKDCSERLGSENFATVNEVYLWKIKIEEFCKPSLPDPPILQNLKKYVLTHFGKIFQVDDIHKVALMLDPNFKHLKFLSDLEKKHIIALVKNMLTDIKNDDPSLVPDLHENKRPRMLLPFFNEYMDYSDALEEESDTMDDEIGKYLSEKIRELPVDILEYWNHSTSYPILKILARKILCIPASSSAHERIFSRTERIFCKRRSRITSKYLDQLIFLHKNKTISYESMLELSCKQYKYQ